MTGLSLIAVDIASIVIDLCLWVLAAVGLAFALAGAWHVLSVIGGRKGRADRGTPAPLLPFPSDRFNPEDAA